MSGVFTLRLAPPYTLARYMQYAFLSVDVDPDKWVFHPDRDMVEYKLYKYFVDHVAKAASLSGLKDCQNVPLGPSLYKLDIRDVISKLPSELVSQCGGATEGKPVIRNWNQAAAGYALSVQAGELQVDGGIKLPMLGVVTVFSSVRGMEYEKQVDIHTLGTTLLGGSLAFAGIQGSRRQGGESYEYFLIPEQPYEGYLTLRAMAWVSGDREGRRPVSSGLVWTMAQLVEELNVSPDIALAFATAVSLAYYLREAGRIDPSVFLYGSQLVTIAPGGNRPNMRSTTPLTPLLYQYYGAGRGESSILLVHRLVRSLLGASGARRQDVENKISSLRKTLGQCIHDMYMQASYPCESQHLHHCIRDLVPLAVDADLSPIVSDERGNMIERLIGRLRADYEQMQGGCRRL